MSEFLDLRVPNTYSKNTLGGKSVARSKINLKKNQSDRKNK